VQQSMVRMDHISCDMWLPRTEDKRLMTAWHLRLILASFGAALQPRLKALQLLLKNLLSRRDRPLAVLAPARPRAIRFTSVHVTCLS
jgi:hypothetical protein